MYRPVLVGLLVAVLAVSATAAGGTLLAADPIAGSDATAQPQLDDEPVDTDSFESTTFELTVHENGDATWTSRYERRLEPGERSAFEEFAEEFEEDDETDLYVRFTEQSRALTDRGAANTDREMEAENFNRSAGIDYRPDAMGYVELSFTWTNFAPVDEDGSVVVGDVFEGGLYLGDDQSFVVKPGDDLAFSAAQPDGQYTETSLEEADSVSWNGQRDFADGQPRIVLRPAGGGGEDDATTWLVAGFLLVLGLGAGFVWYRSDGSVIDAGGGSSGPDPGDSSAAAAADATDDDQIGDEELMTDEDRVVALIRENGGRMKQVAIVEETGWSKSKVSMLLSDMEDEGTISKLRVGRENIISLDGHEPEAARSPFEQ